MKEYDAYSRIHQLREAGVSQRQVVQQLKISRKTVKRYWEMPVTKYKEKRLQTHRVQQLDEYRDQMIRWLR